MTQARIQSGLSLIIVYHNHEAISRRWRPPPSPKISSQEIGKGNRNGKKLKNELYLRKT